jgi:MULE transposase domain
MSLLHAIQITNSGTVIEWFTAPTNDPNKRLFQTVCWAYGPAIEAFKHCKPVIEIDGTHLSKRYKGKMLVVCDFDAEDQLVPLAFALVDTENNKFWEDFMKFVRREVVGSRVMTVLSYHHKSILRVFSQPDLWWNTQDGQAFHRYCSRHIYQNFTKKFTNKKLIAILRQAMKQNQKSKILTRLGRIHEKCPDAVIWLEDINRNNRPRYDLWALSFNERGHRLDMMTINWPETLNNVFKEARELSGTSLVEIIFYKSVKYFVERMTNAETMVQQWFIFSPKIQALLEERRLRENTQTVRAYWNERKIWGSNGSTICEQQD